MNAIGLVGNQTSTIHIHTLESGINVPVCLLDFFQELWSHYLLKWQCRLIFESKFWKNFKVNNHHSGVTYGCTGKHWTVEKKKIQSLPRHLADTVEDVKNQPHRRWKIVFFIFQRKLPKFKKWVWPVKIPWKLSILCL